MTQDVSFDPLRLYDITEIGSPFSPALPRGELGLKPLSPLIDVRVTIQEDKMVGNEVHLGLLTDMSALGSRMQSRLSLLPLSNLKIRFEGTADSCPAGEICAKVIDSGDGQSMCARLRFTSITKDFNA